MIPQRDDDSDPLQVWKRSLPENENLDQDDQEEVSNDGVIGTVAVIVGVIITLVVAAIIGGVILFLKYKNQFGF